MHGDHAAGLVVGETQVYPRAMLHVAEDEIAFWQNPSALDAIQATQAPVAEAALRVYRERLVTIRPGDLILPDVRVRAMGYFGFLLAAGGSVKRWDGSPLVYGKPGFENPAFVARGRI